MVKTSLIKTLFKGYTGENLQVAGRARRRKDKKEKLEYLKHRIEGQSRKLKEEEGDRQGYIKKAKGEIKKGKGKKDTAKVKAARSTLKSLQRHSTSSQKIQKSLKQRKEKMSRALRNPSYKYNINKL